MMTLTRRNLGLAAGMATAVALTAGSMIAFSANAAPVSGESAPIFVVEVIWTLCIGRLVRDWIHDH